MSVALFEYQTGPMVPARGANGVSIGRAIECLLAVKATTGCRQTTIRALKQYLWMFAKGREDQPIASFTVEVVEEWFRSRREKPVTEASNRGRLGSLFSYVFRRQWIRESPMQYLEKLRVDRRVPFTLTPLQCALVLDYARRRKPGQLAFWAIGMFCGVRPGEIEHITWNDLNLEDGKLTIGAHATKIRTRRIVDLEPTAVAWLKFAKEEGGRLPVRLMTRRRYHRQAARLLGLEGWPADCTRHTSASMLLARHKNPNYVAFQLGNSPGILQRHYMNLVTQQDCEAFWSFLPDSPRPEKPKAEPKPLPEPPVLPAVWGVMADPALPRFVRAEQALAMEGTIRALARQRQKDGSYYGGTHLKRMPGERLDTIRELGKLAGVSRQTIRFCKHVIAKADPDVLDRLRRDRMAIHAAYKLVIGGAR